MKNGIFHELRYWSCRGVKNESTILSSMVIVTFRYSNALICTCVQFSKNCIPHGYCRWMIVSVEYDNAPYILPWIGMCRQWNAPVCTCMHFLKESVFCLK